MSEPAESEYITLARAASQLKWSGTPKARARRLRRQLEAIERTEKVKIIQVMKVNHRTARRVTIKTLRRYCPDLFRKTPADIAKEVGKYLKRIDERIDDRVHAMTAPQFEELRAVDEELTIQLKNLANRIARTL